MHLSNSRSQKLFVAMIVAMLGLTAAGCQQQMETFRNLTDCPEARTTSAFEIGAPALAAYIENQGISDLSSARAERIRKNFAERSAMATAAMAEFSGDEQWLAGVNADIAFQRNETIIKSYVDKYTRDAATAEKIEAYFQEHIDDYSTMEVSMDVFLVPVAGDESTETFEAKQAFALSLVENKDSGAQPGNNEAGAEFEFTRVLSADQTVQLRESGLDGTVIKAVARMEEGSVSSPLQTSDGFVTIRLVHRNVTEVTPLDSVRDKIAYDLGYAAKLQALGLLKNAASNPY